MVTSPSIGKNSVVVVVVVFVSISSFSSSCNRHDVTLRDNSNPATGLNLSLTDLSNAS